MITPFQGLRFLFASNHRAMPYAAASNFTMIYATGDSNVCKSVGGEEPVFQDAHGFKAALFEEVEAWHVCDRDSGIELMEIQKGKGIIKYQFECVFGVPFSLVGGVN